MKSSKLQTLLELSNKNLGAIEALKSIYNYDYKRARKLGKMMKKIGMTGSKIWVGYKYCKMNVHKFMNCVEKNDIKMILYINKMVQRGGCGNSNEIQTKS
jgi:lambda repressor-like predicted transcriptional regulator